MTGTADIAAKYDEAAATYDSRYTRNTDLAEDRVLYGWLRPVVDGRRVLDVGCGTGNLLRHCQPADYVGVDASPKMLERADARARSLGYEYPLSDPRRSVGCVWVAENAKLPISRSADFYDMDARDGMPPGLYDTVVSLWALPHMDPLDKTVELMAAVVKPGGWLIVQGFAERYVKRPNYIFNGDGRKLFQATTIDGLHAAVERAGLLVHRTAGFRYLLDPPLLGHLPVPVLERAFRWSSEHLNPADAATHLIFARKPPDTAA